MSTHALALFKRLGITDGVTDVRDALRNVQVLQRVVQDFRPLCESLEWKLSEVFWSIGGLRGFLLNEVPYTVNNSGSLSAQAAELLFANCLEFPPGERVIAVEIGAGIGLFSRYLLDEFKQLCRERGQSFYNRLTIYISDRSSKTVEQWKSAGLFGEHQAHVVPVVCDGRDIAGILPANERVRAIFANYVLDSLPAMVLRNGPDGPEEQHVRTHLAENPHPAQSSKLNLDEIRAIAATEDPENLARLLPWLSAMEFESEFRPLSGPGSFVEEALTFDHDLERIVLNSDAFECLERWLALLENDGFILINDYGSISPGQTPPGTQRFGYSSAIGLNFPLLEHHFSTRGSTVVCPERDDLLGVHPRLLMKRALPDTRNAFLRIFHGNVNDAVDACTTEARQHAEAGRADKARESYLRAMELRPRDWQLIGETAEFVVRHVADYESGLRLAHAALALNPWYSVWLWNVLGEALSALNRFDEAHEAYLEARRIEPADVRTCLNLGNTYAQSGELDQALAAIAEGLGYDRTGVFRARLLEKQGHVLALISQRWESEKESQSRRVQRLAQ